MKNENGLTPGCYGPSVIPVCWGTHWFTSAMVHQGSGASIDDNAWWSVVHGVSQYRCAGGVKLYCPLQSCANKTIQTKAIELKKIVIGGWYYYISIRGSLISMLEGRPKLISCFLWISNWKTYLPARKKIMKWNTFWLFSSFVTLVIFICHRWPFFR